jgi:hypothetical protein
VKTAISIPDDTFERASTRARDLGMSRSEFFATAAQHYLDELDAQSITVQIVYSGRGAPGSPAPACWGTNNHTGTIALAEPRANRPG